MTDNIDKLKKIIYVAGAVAAVLAIAFVIVTVKDTRLVHDLNDEKQDLTERIVALQQDYAGLSSDYEEVNCQLDSSREEVAQLIEHIKKTDATNRAKMKQYERELGTLRAIMRGYIVQIDSLNNANQKLEAEVARARKAARERDRQNAALSQQVEQLSNQVAAGSVIKARNIKTEAYNSSDKVNDRSSRTTYLVTSLTLLENDIAAQGFITVYVRVINPSGDLLIGGSRADGVMAEDASGAAPRSFTVGGETYVATACREVEYLGSDLDMSIYTLGAGPYEKGEYLIEVYTDYAKLGESTVYLR